MQQEPATDTPRIDDVEGGRREVLGQFIRELWSSADTLPPRWLEIASPLVTDAIRDSDAESLAAAASGLQRLYRLQTRIPNPSGEQLEQHSQVVGFLKLLQVASDRVVPALAPFGVDQDTHARRMLELIASRPGAPTTEIRNHLGMDASAVSRCGRVLVNRGLARKFRIGKSVYWESTARGQEALGSRSRRTDDARERISVTFEPADLVKLVHEAAGLQGLGESATHSRGRLVAPTTQILTTVLGAGALGTDAAGIARNTELSGQTILTAIDALISRRVISAGGGDISTAILRANTDDHCAVGISMHKGLLVGVVTDLGARSVLRSCEQKLTSHEPVDVLESVYSLLDALRAGDESDWEGRNPIGVGVELPGHIDGVGAVRMSPNWSWSGKVDLRSPLELQSGLATVVENDVNAQAIYHQLYGAGTGVTDLVVVLLDEGIGSGIIVNNQLVRGSSGGAGEIGHIPLGVRGEVCGCGAYGCIEATASISSIIRRLNGKVVNSPVSSIEEAIDRVESEQAPVTVFEEAGRALGLGIATLLDLLNPDMILLEVPASLSPRGPKRLAKATRVFEAELRRAVAEHAFSSSSDDCRLVINHFSDGPLYGARGAAAAIIGSFIQDPLNDRFYHGKYRDQPPWGSSTMWARSEATARDMVGSEITIPQREEGTGPLQMMSSLISVSLAKLGTSPGKPTVPRVTPTSPGRLRGVVKPRSSARRPRRPSSPPEARND